MEVSFSDEIRSLDCQVPLLDGRIWRIDWFGRICLKGHEPMINVVFKPIRGGGDYSPIHEEAFCYEIRASYLPALGIGSHWRKGQLIKRDNSDPGIETIEIKSLEFWENNIQFCPTVPSDRPSRISSSDYPIKSKEGYHGQIMAVANQTDSFHYLIPCMEVVRFYYGTSSKLSRNILRGIWTCSIERNVIFIPGGEKNSIYDSENRWTELMRGPLAACDYALEQSIAQRVANSFKTWASPVPRL